MINLKDRTNLIGIGLGVIVVITVVTIKLVNRSNNQASIETNSPDQVSYVPSDTISDLERIRLANKSKYDKRKMVFGRKPNFIQSPVDSVITEDTSSVEPAETTTSVVSKPKTSKPSVKRTTQHTPQPKPVTVVKEKPKQIRTREGFNTAETIQDQGEMVMNKKFAMAVVEGNQKANGDRSIRIRLKEDFLSDGKIIPANTILYGQLKGMKSNRALIRVSGSNMRKSVDVYDAKDELKGLDVEFNRNMDKVKTTFENTTQKIPGITVQTNTNNTVQSVNLPDQLIILLPQY